MNRRQYIERLIRRFTGKKVPSWIVFLIAAAMWFDDEIRKIWHWLFGG